MNGWFPRYNTRGDIVSGYGSIWVNSNLVVNLGYRPQWYSDDTIVYVGPNDNPYICDLLSMKETRINNNKVSAVIAGNGNVFELPTVFIREIAASIDKYSGALVTIVEHNKNNNDRSVVFDGIPLSEHKPITDIRINQGLITWSEITSYPLRKTLGYKFAIIDLTVVKSEWEAHPVPFLVKDEPWVLIQTNTDLRLHPWNNNFGYIIDTGEDYNLNPDVYCKDNEIRVAWNDKFGVMAERRFFTNQPRVDISKPITIPEPKPIIMKLSEEVRNVRDLFIEKFPFPIGVPGEVFENEFRKWFGRLVEQIVYSFPSMGFGWKAQSPTHPPSKDSLAQKNNNKSFYSYDMFSGVGTGNPTKVDSPDGSLTTNQFFIEVTGVNHLSTEVPNGEYEEDDLEEIYNELDKIGIKLTGIETTLENVVKLVAFLSERVDKLERTPIIFPDNIAKKGDGVEVEGSINLKSVLTNSKVKWNGKIT